MTRILADLPDDDIEWLDARASALGKSRAAILREAVSAFKADGAGEDGLGWLDQGFGLWARAGLAIDPRDYERRRRAEWTRPWDEDYEEVRAESPDLFDAEDDRQRQVYVDMLKGRYPQAKAPPRG